MTKQSFALQNIDYKCHKLLTDLLL